MSLRIALSGAIVLLSACNEPPAAAPVAPPAPAAAAQPPPALAVDTCALLDPAAVAARLGRLLSGPTAQPAQGSLLGQCDYLGERALVTVSARPAGEFDATVRYAGKGGSAAPVPGLGASAMQTPYGLMLQPAGKPYFIVVYALAGTEYAGSLALDVARDLKL